MKVITESSKREVDKSTPIPAFDCPEIEGMPVPAFVCPKTEGCYCIIIDPKNESSYCACNKSAADITGQESYWDWFINSKVFHTCLDPTHLHEILRSLKEAMFDPTHWQALGSALGLLYNSLDVIANKARDDEVCLRMMLQKWLEKGDNASEATWYSLVKALKDICVDQKAVAEKIRCKLQNTITE
uniref:Death domain-containing protein n=1 Tax=Amphimedon queenslandica TaxID=400682 RepID=A0A1X7SMG3_AMPQE